MNIKYLYPNFKRKAFVLSYDDGVIDDREFIDILNELRMKATFNLNTELMKNNFSWTHKSGYEVRRLPLDIVNDLYQGHEIASHSSTHTYFDYMSNEEIYENIAKDLRNIPFLRGFATPFTYFDNRLKDIVRSLSFEYLRCSIMSENFHRFRDYYEIQPTLFHLDNRLEDFLESFLKTDEELAVFLLVGHTYDLRVENKFEYMKNLFKHIMGNEDIINMTTIEIVDYLKAIDSLIIEEKNIINPSNQSVFLEIDNTQIAIEANSRYILDK